MAAYAHSPLLLDLGRNDVGRVAEYGSVRVTAFLTIERYSHVMHLVSEVRGRLAPGYAADFAVLEQDPLSAPLDELAGLTARLTMVAGQVVHGD